MHSVDNFYTAKFTKILILSVLALYKIITKSIDKHEIMCYNTDKNRTETPDRTGGVPNGLTARIAIKNQRKDVLPMQRYKGG